MSDRLIGVETEYALFFVPREPGSPAPLPREIFEVAETAVRNAVPSLPAAIPKGGVFLSNGGLLHYEAPTLRFSTGLLEMATPECRGPVEAAKYHHAQDRLLLSIHAEAERRLRLRGYDGELVFGKSSADAAGNVWGSHENYDVDDPAGPARAILLAAAFPFFWIPLWIVEFALKAALAAVFLSGAAAYLLCSSLAQIPLAGRPFAAAARALFRLSRAALREENLVRFMDATYVLTIPWIRAYSAFLRLCILRRARRLLLPHLLTRAVYAGPGRVEPAAGRIGLSQKGPAIRAASGVFWDDTLRPVFDLKNFVRAPWSVFRRRKRLQVLFSDSSMSRLATVLKLGTTDLVLHMIEAGHPLRDLTPRDPVQALSLVNADPGLAAAIPLEDGNRMTALEIQEYYLGEADKFFGRDARGETGEILAKWRYVLDALREDPHLLYKDVDWVTKRDVVAEALREEGGWKGLRGGVSLAAAPAAVALKVDARFHEISPRGYWFVLAEAGQVRPYFEAAELDRAVREPPAASTSRQRGDAVRQYAPTDRDARVSWTHLYLRKPRRKMRFG
ncbi:MAG: proteasome accessory factor PafA2 family protein [Planctomycetes bacterium]|nr:proteasome accessory factor PafA2 family protein [Planctomycetota bacterium]